MKLFAFILLSFFTVLDVLAQVGPPLSDSLKAKRDEQMLMHRLNYEGYLWMMKHNPKRAMDSLVKVRVESGSKPNIDYSGNGRLDTLKEMDLSYSGLTAIPDFVFEARNLVSLNLDYNKISKLPRKLKRLTKLENVYWRANSLADRNRVKISKLISVHKLDISTNMLGKLPKSFAKFKNLQELTMDENLVTELPIGVLSRFDSLKYLRLNKDPLLKISPGAYHKLSSLEIIKLNNNGLESIDSSFYTITSLKELQLQENNLRSLPNGISKLKNLSSLSLYKNQIQNFPDDLFNLNLTALDLYYNQLEVIPEAIANFKSLSILYLANNKIYSLPEALGQLTGLKEVYLHHNRLSVLPESIKNLIELEVLRVNNNFLVDFPSPALSLVQLKDLDISYNQIEYLPSEIGQLKYLKLFTYQENPIDLSTPKNRGVAPVLYQMSQRGIIVVPEVSLSND